MAPFVDVVSTPCESMANAALGLLVMNVTIAILIMVRGGVRSLPRRVASFVAEPWPVSRTREAAVTSTFVASVITAAPATFALIAHVRF